jgi:hypothetical protein
MLVFRLQREVQMEAEGEFNWIPWADWLYIAATIAALLEILVLVNSESCLALRVARFLTCLAVIFLIGYVPSILAHYRLIFGNYIPRKPYIPRRKAISRRSRLNPEPAELISILVTVVVILSMTAIMIVIYALCG